VFDCNCVGGMAWKLFVGVSSYPSQTTESKRAWLSVAGMTPIGVKTPATSAAWLVTMNDDGSLRLTEGIEGGFKFMQETGIRIWACMSHANCSSSVLPTLAAGSNSDHWRRQ
jgi:hypothetical protein